MPESLDVSGVPYARVTTWKHDFFAATGLYQHAGRGVVVKIARRGGFLGIPLNWVGRLLTRHEADLLNRLGDLDGIPRLVGIVGDNVLVHAFVPGRALHKGERVDDHFFTRLSAILAELHRRGIAYVDLEKPTNVLVADDGKPYLVDFQISWPWPLGWFVRTPLAAWLCRRLQQADLYHLRKLRRRFRPDQMSPRELAQSYHRPWPVRLHARLTRPLTRLRRRALAKLDPVRYDGERGRTD
ncbi:MAG TPA: hypothetical protein VM243_03415 [Phycisphaerae bacterium]|nr:hypothetical protein [Phycisphaerae bacterium]